MVRDLVARALGTHSDVGRDTGVANTDNRRWSLTCSETAVQTRVWRMGALSSQWLHLLHGVRAGFRRGAPSLTWVHGRDVRRQDDRWGDPRGSCLRPLGL